MLCRRVISTFLLLASGSIVGLSGCDSKGDASARKPPVPAVPGPVDSDAPEEFTTTESGLKYRIRRKSDGKKPDAESNVTVHYRGWLDDEEIFDSTYGTAGTPSTLSLPSLIPGWREGMLLIGEGAMIELEVPSRLGYGEAGHPPIIPEKATLHFLVELIKVAEPAAPPKDEHVHGPTGAASIEPGPVDPDASDEFIATASGLKYRIRRKSTGKSPTAANSVKVHYRGWLDNGGVFDESYARGEPITFPLGGVIKGWTEGLQLVGQGGMIELEIPSDLGYGPGGQPPKIPGGATLHFLVELLEVK